MIKHINQAKRIIAQQLDTANREYALDVTDGRKMRVVGIDDDGGQILEPIDTASEYAIKLKSIHTSMQLLAEIKSIYGGMSHERSKSTRTKTN